MGCNLEDRMRTLRARYEDQLLTVLTILLLLLMFVVAPLQAAGLVAFDIFGVIVALAMVGGVLIMSGSLVASTVILVAVCLNVVVIVLRLLDARVAIDLYVVAAAWLVITLTLGCVVGRNVFGPGKVSYHRIVGAVLLYFLIAMSFASLFTFVALIAPKAFSGIVMEDNSAIGGTLIYFSLVTLTTTGYGDIFPVHPIARSLCNLEAVIGQLYPATLLARLVSLEVAGRD